VQGNSKWDGNLHGLLSTHLADWADAQFLTLRQVSYPAKLVLLWHIICKQCQQLLLGH
jgi:hypothetical protein